MKFTKHLPAVACSSALFLAFTAPAAYTQKPTPPSSEELAAITERGILLNEYDQAAWHASDAVQTANPKTIDGQRWIAKKENGKWTVVFGKLNAEKTAFEIHYEAIQQSKPQEFAVHEVTPPRPDKDFFLHASKAVDLALADFHGEKRPYNYAVLPTPLDQLFVYIYPVQTKARVYPLGGDVRYLFSSDGGKILEKHQLHKTIIENPTPDKAKKLAAGFHTHVLSGSPEDTDVFHVLTQDPRMPEIVATPHFVFKILVDGAITVEKTRN